MEPQSKTSTQKPSFHLPKMISKQKKSTVDGLEVVMACVGCSRIPHPSYRFLCSKGHMFCKVCGTTRFTNEGLCGTPIQVETMPGLTSTGVGVCANKVQRYPEDPVYSTLYMESKWRCPHHEDLTSPCSQLLFGKEMEPHWEEFHGGKHFPGDEETIEDSLEELESSDNDNSSSE